MEHFLAAKSVVSHLVNAGHVAYFAGGWVRDFLLEHPSDDIDIATSASVEQVQDLFPHTIPVGIAFGIVIVVMGKYHFEVASFRKESDYLDGRRPTSVQKASAEEDAQRRDFTINGMFWDPLEEKLYDFVGGQTDLRRRVIRAIGDPHKRFLEDRLRMIRAVRYATRFQFEVDKDTAAAIVAHASSLFPAVAMERVWQEFKKMSAFAHVDRGLLALHELHLLGMIFPSLKEVPLPEIQRRLSPLAFFPEKTPAIAEVMELFSDASEQRLLELCDYLKVSNEEKELALFLQKTKHLFQMPSTWLDKLELYEWAKFYAHPQAALGLAIAAAHRPPEHRKSFFLEQEKRQDLLQAGIERLRAKTPLVRAEHLVREGVMPGRRMGLLLQEAERIAINQHLSSSEQIISVLKNSPSWHAR